MAIHHHIKTKANSLYAKRHQIGYFAILIIVALLSDLLLNYIGTFSQAISVVTSTIYILCLITIGITGLAMLSKDIENPLSKSYLLSNLKKFPKRALHLILPLATFILGSIFSFILLIIPGVLFVIRSMFMFAEVSLDRRSIKDAYQSSFEKTSKITKYHLRFFIMFAINQFLFIYTSTIISDRLLSSPLIILVFPLLVLVSYLTAILYLELYNKEPVKISQ